MTAVVAVACAATIATAATPIALGAGEAGDDRAASRSWNPFFEQLRPVDVVDARRVVVSFADPSLGEWAAAGDRKLDATSRTAWLAKARKLQQQRLDALGMAGVQFTVEHRYIRVLNGASLVVHGDGSQLLRDMAGVSSVTPVRTMWPTAIADDAGAAGAAAAAGATPSDSDARPVTVAVLDTGIDARHPAVAGRVDAAFDATASTEAAAGAAGAAAAAGSTTHADPHGTAVAGAVLAGASREANVRISPVQVLDARPARDGAEAVLGDSDDLLAGLEHAVDPDGDGATSDAADVAVVASTAPFAGFTGSPEDRAVRAADALGTVVVAASGNDGASGDAVGTIGSVAASSGALAIGAADLRGTTPAADVRVRGGGVDETFTAAPLLTTDAKLPGGELKVVVVEETGDDVVDYLDAELRSRVGGSVALVLARDGATIAAQVRAAADAGAVAVLVGADGAGAAAGTIDVDGADVPAVGIARDDARALRDALVAGSSLAVEFDATTERNPAFGTVAGFSSGGPRLDGAGRPDALAPGVGMLVAGAGGGWRHASGTSIAAAWAAGQVASLRSAKPDWDPARVRAALLGSAITLGEDGGDRPDASLQGAGVLDAERAAAADWIATRGRIDFGTVAPGSLARRPLALAALTGGRLAGTPRILLDDGGAEHGVSPTLDGNDLVLSIDDAADDGHVGGWLVLPDQGLRVPWSATVRDAAAATVPLEATLSSQVLRPVAGPGAFASSLQVAIGGDGDRADSLGIAAVQKLEVRLVDARGRDHGVLGGLHQALPGIYDFGVTGVDADGKRLAAGRWQLHVRYVPASDPDGAWRTGPTATFAVAPARSRAK